MSEARRREIKNCADIPLRLYHTRQGHAPQAVTQRVSRLWKERFGCFVQENDLVGDILTFLRKTPDLQQKFLDSLGVPESD